VVPGTVPASLKSSLGRGSTRPPVCVAIRASCSVATGAGAYSGGYERVASPTPDHVVPDPPLTEAPMA
jgi:hypothetical protein